MTRPANFSRTTRDQVDDAATSAAALVAIAVERASGRTVPGEIKARLRAQYRERILADAMRVRIAIENPGRRVAL